MGFANDNHPAASPLAAVDALIDQLFPIRGAVARAEAMVEAERLYDQSPESGLSFVDYVVRRVGKKQRGYSRAAIFETLRRGKLADDVRKAVKGSDRFDTVGRLNELTRLAPEYRIPTVRAWLSGQPAPGAAVPLPSAPPDDWWASVPGFIETADRFYVPGVVDQRRGDSKVILPTLPADSFHVITDNPYGIAYRDAQGRTIAGDFDPEVIASWAVPAMARVAKRDSFIVTHGRWDVNPTWQHHLRLAGTPQRAEYVWDKVHASGAGGSGTALRSQHETIMVAHKGSPHLYEWVDHYGFTDTPGLIVKRDVGLWSIRVPLGDERGGHPTPKPVKLGMRLMLNFAPPGGVVLDPFMGEGPFAVAAIRLGRPFIGIELEAPYFAAAVKRVKDALLERGPLVVAEDALAA